MGELLEPLATVLLRQQLAALRHVDEHALARGLACSTQPQLQQEPLRHVGTRQLQPQPRRHRQVHHAK